MIKETKDFLEALNDLQEEHGLFIHVFDDQIVVAEDKDLTTNGIVCYTGHAQIKKLDKDRAILRK